MRLWRDIHDSGHWVLRIGARLFHYYGWNRPRKQHFYIVDCPRGYDINEPFGEHFTPNWDPEFRRVF